MSTSYGQFCPVSMAAEVVCSRWTLLVVRELLCGSTRFNDLRRGVPRMSPALLSKRLRELEQAGVIRVVPTGLPGVNEYQLTEAGQELRPVVMGLGDWGQRWVESKVTLRNLDPRLLMWDMRRWIDTSPFPPGRSTIQFEYPEIDEKRRSYWMVVEDGQVDLCYQDPGYEVDLWVRSPLRVLTAIWMGYTRLEKELASGAVETDGSPLLARTMPIWLGLSPFAKVPRPEVA